MEFAKRRMLLERKAGMEQFTEAVVNAPSAGDDSPVVG